MTLYSTQLEFSGTLEKLGLDDREAAVYISLLENGPQLPQHIARSTGLKRTTLYELFPDLIKTGAIVEIQQGKRRLFQATPPESLLRKYEQNYREIKQNIAELTDVYRMQGLKPKIEVYEGFDGLKKLYLRTLEIKKTIGCYVQVTKYNEQMLNWLTKEYVPMRVKRNIDVRAILPAEIESEYHMAHDKEQMRVTRTVPWNKFPFKIEGMIQGDRMYFANYEKGKPLVGIIIESRQIATTQAAIFDLAWEGAEKYQK